MRTAFKRFALFAFFFVFPTFVFAEALDVADENVSVNADIRVDLFSTVTLKPETVEIYQPSTVEVRVIAPNGQPLSGHSIVIVASGVAITQPTNTTDVTGKTTGSVFSGVPGTYSICAKDTTFGYDITIEACKTLYVRPLTAPNMLPEPAYTKGVSNVVMWQNIGSGYSYLVQASRNASFTDVIGQSNWIGSTSFEFKNLVNGQMYFYRVKAKNLYGGESAWSSSVFSVQDSENPSIETLNITGVGENNTVNWKNDFEVTMTFRVTDNLALKNTSFSCLRRNGSSYDCAESSSMEGDNLVVKVRLDSLERVSGVYLYENYGFCVEADDQAGNVSRICNISLTIPKGQIPGGDEEPPKKPDVIDRIDKGIEDLNEALDNTIGNLDQDDLETVTTTTSIVTASTAITIAAGTLWQIPYFLTQLVLSILSWFGFRKKGKSLGFVYDAVTKEPVAQAIVRVFDESNRMVWSDVTDYNGSFNAHLPEGRYLIKVRSSRYSFPSNIVFGKEDYPLSNIYHGESFEVNEEEDIKYAIPLDPLEMSRFRMFTEGLFSRFKFVFTFLHILLFVVGAVVSIYTCSRYPSTVNFVILLLFIPSFFLIVRNVLSSKGRYGVVTDINKKRLEGIVVGLREMEFEKIVSKRVTDKWGRYRFVIGKGEYQLEVLETGYSVERIKGGDVVSVKGNGENVVARDIVLRDVSKK